MSVTSNTMATALRLHQSGELARAEQLYKQILQAEPTNAEAWHLTGVVAQQTGRQEAAVQNILKAIALDATKAPFHCNLGVAYRALGQFREAESSLRRAIHLAPDYGHALFNLGGVLLRLGKASEAEEQFRRAIQIKSDFALAHNGLANALRAQGRAREAVVGYRAALRCKPDMADVQNSLGNVLRELGDLDEALACHREAIRLKPDNAEAHNDLAIALNSLDTSEEAAEHFRRAVELNPGFAEAHQNLGNLLRDEGRLDEAVACYRTALALRPDFAEAHNNFGVALQAQGHIQQALERYEAALQIKPDLAWAHFNRSHALLLIGDFAGGWPEYEWRWKRPGSSNRSFVQPLWDGSALDGKTILLHAEQGLGDSLQFVRYAPLVKERGGNVVLECQASLIPLLSRCEGIDRFVAKGSALPHFDVQVPLLRLPGVFRTTVSTVPALAPYVFPDPTLVEKWRDRVGSIAGFKIGINWQGNPKYQRDYHRSLPLRHFAPLARIPGITLISLQKGIGRDQIERESVEFPVQDLGSDFDEGPGAFMDSAAIMQSLDLVVTSDTAIPHLAGALAVPVWMATPFSPDWRWLLDREDSPWYRTMRLFRQSRLGDWDEVFERIAAELRHKVQPTSDGAETQTQFAGERYG